MPQQKALEGFHGAHPKKHDWVWSVLRFLTPPKQKVSTLSLMVTLGDVGRFDPEGPFGFRLMFSERTFSFREGIHLTKIFSAL